MDAQWTGPVTIQTPLGAALKFRSMGGVEAISRPFVFEVTVISQRADIRPDELLGQGATVQVDLAKDGNDVRSWNGVVSSMEYVITSDDGWSTYHLTLRPWLWQLGLAADCRIFQNLSIPDIAKKVFERRGFANYELDLSEEYAPREYVVQYRESDLDFVSRLLESEGIHYFFRHESGRHTLVLADSPHAHSPVEGYGSLPYAGQDAHRNETMQYVRVWRSEGRLETGAYASVDFDFTRPRLRLRGSAAESQETAEAGLETFDYPGGYLQLDAASATARLRLQQARRDSRGARGETNARGLTVGATFKLVDHPRDDQNQNYLVTWTRVRLRTNDVGSSNDAAEEPFACAFGVVDAQSTFRPPLQTTKPFVHGLQTAIVVGPGDQDIFTDQYGRIKVQFHWDREGDYDQNSSCWVRVAQSWAGTGWGAQFIPRIGQEVVVAFLEGDPDRPLVTGSVYNGSHMPPFTLPAQQTQSGIRSRSTPRGGVPNANEIRLEDAVGREEIYVQAEKDLNTLVKNNQTSNVAHDRSTHIGNDDTLRIDSNHLRTIALNETVSVGATQTTRVGIVQTIFVGAAQDVTVGTKQTINVTGDRTLTVGGADDTAVTASQTLNVGGNLTRQVKGKVDETTEGTFDETVNGRTVSTHRDHRVVIVSSEDGDRSASLHVKGAASAFASTTIDATATKSITVTCGKSQIVLLPESITFTSPKLVFNATQEFDVNTVKLTVGASDAVALTGSKVTIQSSGASVALDSNATVQGSKVQLGAGSGGSSSASTKPPKVTTIIVKDDAGKPLANRAVILRFGGEGGSERTVALDDKGQVVVTGDDPFDVLVPDVTDAKSA